jgi:hypothetical protein
MCCCGKPTIDGEPNAYSWDGVTRLTYETHPPAMIDGDVLLFDEPGRCGKIDAHGHHLRLVKNCGRLVLLSQRGDSAERLTLFSYMLTFAELLATLDSNARYWILHMIHSTAHAARRDAEESTRNAWAKAFIEKRIKKQKRSGSYRVWLEETTTV